MSNIRNSSTWRKYEPVRRGSIKEKYAGRFVVILNTGKAIKTLYVSDMIIAKLVQPKYIGIAYNEDSPSMIGLWTATKETGVKVEYKSGATPSINITGFVKSFETETKLTFNPGAYECHVETIDAQTVDHYDMIVFDTQEAPSQVRANGAKPERAKA